MKQLNLLQKQPKSYGGELLKTRKGRSGPRPLAIRDTMHLVLRSSKARGDWAFNRGANPQKIKAITKKFGEKYAVRILSAAYVGNHLHFQIQLTNRFTYKPFIRAITSAIAMAITGASRWKPLKTKASDRFWDYRPFTRVVQGFRALLKLKHYIEINRMEGFGMRREQAAFFVAWNSARNGAYG